jgi:hypothetical protein
MERNSFFFAGTWKKFPRMSGTGKQKKGTQKGMHNLAHSMVAIKKNATISNNFLVQSPSRSSHNNKHEHHTQYSNNR